MAESASIVIAEERIGDGHQFGATGQATARDASTAATAVTALGFLVTYLLVRSGLESDPEDSVMLGGALAVVATKVAGYFAGKRAAIATPSSGGVERTLRTALAVPVERTGGPINELGIPAIPTDGSPLEEHQDVPGGQMVLDVEVPTEMSQLPDDSSEVMR